MPLCRADRRRHEHLPADWGPVPPGGHRHPTAEDLEDALLCWDLWEESAPVRTGLHDSLPGPFHFLHFLIQHVYEAYLHCLLLCHGVPDLHEI